MQDLKAICGAADHTAEVVGKRKQRFTRGGVARALRKILPGSKKLVQGRAYACSVGLVEQAFNRTHNIFLLGPARRITRLAHIGIFEKGIEIPQNLLRINAKPLAARFGGEGSGVALVHIPAGVAFGIGIGDIAARDRNPGLRGVEGALPYIKKTAEHDYSLPEISAACGCWVRMPPRRP